jgi:hypothetical protein
MFSIVGTLKISVTLDKFAKAKIRYVRQMFPVTIVTIKRQASFNAFQAVIIRFTRRV